MSGARRPSSKDGERDSFRFGVRRGLGEDGGHVA